MVVHKNFYENAQEALIRLRNTVVMYDGEPYYIHTIAPMEGDDVLRVYMTPLDKVMEVTGMGSFVPCYGHSHPHGSTQLGAAMNTFMTANPTVAIVRKKMNSPLFNRFRPFPLGMVNIEKNVVYVERQPSRKTEQGLTGQMVYAALISIGNTQTIPLDIFNESFRDCIMGVYPSPKEALEYVSSDKFVNTAVGFHRQFALVRGPLGLIFLVYKAEIVGSLPNRDFSEVKLGREFTHTREVINDLNLFSTIRTTS